MALQVFKRGELKRGILIKYLYKELFLYFLICFAFLFVVFFANQILLIGEDMLSKRAPFKDVAKIMIYSMPAIIAQSAPFATLVGFLMCLGRMSSDNEILIFRASGFSFRSILKPVLIMGLAISLVSFFVNDYLLPLGTIKYNQLYRQIMRSNPSVVLESNSVKRIGGSTVVIGDVNDPDVSDIIFFNTKEGREETIIVAGPSVLKGAKNQGVLLQLDMADSMMTTFDLENFNNYEVLSAENTILNLFDSVITGRSGKNPREMTFYDLNKEIKLMRDEGEDPMRINTWMMEYYKKFAIPFGSIFFAFLAFSIAFLFGKHNGLTMGLFIGIIICVLYWALQISGQLLVTRVNLNSFLCIWVPNILIAVVSAILCINLIRK
ncbi:MAG: LptF/LptG family permease [Treponema sp.]|nr:LptF/LptG family permease [Treponema sp.]